MRLGIFLKFVLLVAVMAFLLGTAGLLTYKNYRQGYYEGVASAQLATAVVGVAGVLNVAVETNDRQVNDTLGIFAMFPFLLCVEMSTSTGQSYRWPPLPCEIIKEEKYPLEYPDVLADGGDLRFFVSRQWVNEEVSRELRVGMLAMAIFLLIFLIGSGIVFHRVVGYPVGFLIKNLRDISKDLTKQELIKKLTRDEIGELTDALNGLLGRVREYQSELVRLANTDGLTGILNRRTFFARAQGLLDRYEEGVYFIQIDLDHFKNVNDTYGHGVGDQVLELVGRLLQGSVRIVGEREPDLVGRLGGEEFGIFLRTNNLQEAHSVAERLRATLQSTEVETGAEILTVTGSFGVAEKIRGETLDELYHRADQACYQAKDRGRNQVVVATVPAIESVENE
ncbi:GGDEF domain-containing protein [Gammaproteobacteria bacterium]|nr:GGDEF domain-containing protein [Gammaproteobacteria bacterium]